MRIKHKMKRGMKRIASVLLTIAIIGSSLSITKTVQAASSVAAPDAKTYVSNWEDGKGFKASNFNSTYNLYNNYSQQVYYGKGNQRWYIAGKNGDDATILICDPEMPFANMDMSSEDYYYKSSNIRSYLLGLVNGTGNDKFTAAQQGLMKNSSIYCCKTSSTEMNDKLYLPYGVNEEGSTTWVTVGNNSSDSNDLQYNANPGAGRKVHIRTYFRKGSAYWTRGELNSVVCLAVMPGYTVSAVSRSSMYNVVPVMHLDTSKILFASTATPAAADATLNADNILSLRFIGTGKVTSSAVAKPSGVTITNPTAGEYLYVQYKEGSTNKVKSYALESGKTTYGQADGLPKLSSDCKVWIEKYVSSDDLVYAVNASFVHEHDYVATVNENTIEVYCDNPGCPDGTSSDNKAIATLTAGEMYYTGEKITYSNSSASADVKLSLNQKWTNANLAAPTIKYEGVGSTVYENQTERPSEVGTYKVNMTYGDKTAEIPFEIKMGMQSVTLSMADYSFDNIPSTPSISNAKEAPSITYYYNTTNSNENGTKWENIEGDTLTPADYYMYAVLGETTNYSEYKTIPVKFSIIGSSFSASDLTVGSYNDEYDGQEHSIEVTADDSITGVTVTYSDEVDGTYQAACPAYKNQGSYTVYYKVSKRGYYDYKGSTSIVINKKEASIDWSNTSLVYDGNSKTPTAIVSNLCGTDTCTVSVTGDQTNAGTSYTATANSLSNDNYKLPTTKPTASFSISPKEIGIVWGATSFDYDGTQSYVPTATASGLCGSDVCDITVTGSQTAVGSNYQATAVSLSNTNYKLPENCSTYFSINPIAMSVSSQDVSKTYDGNAYAIPVEVVLPNSSGDTYEVKYGLTEGNYNLTECPTRTNYGETEVYYQVTSANYVTYTGSQTIRISKKAIDGVSATGKNVQYDGNSYEIEVTKPTQASVVYSLEEDGDYSQTNPSFKNKGNYTVYYKVSINDNYDVVTGQETVNISAKPTGIAWGNTSFVYDGTDQAPTASATDLVSGDSCDVVVSGAKKDASDAQYTATAVSLSNSNYVFSGETTTPFTIAKKNVTVSVEDCQKHIGKKDPKLTYSVDGIVTGETLTGITLERECGEAAKTYTILAAKDDSKDTNYNITIDGTGIFTICDHNWASFVYDKNATTFTDGTNTYSCSECEAQKKGIAEGTKIAVVNPRVEIKTEKIGDGEACVKVIEEPVVPNVTVTNISADLIKAILTEEELESVNQGTSCNIMIEVLDISGSLSEEEKAQIVELAKTLNATMDDALFLDLSIYTQLGDVVTANRVTSTNGYDVAFTFEVPSNMINTNTEVERSYYIIQCHEGKAKVIPVEYNEETHNIVFSVSDFSTYTLFYSDKAKESEVSITSNPGKNVKAAVVTGDTSSLIVALMMAFAGIGCVAFIFAKKRRV